VESAPKDVAVDRLAKSGCLQRANERVLAPGTLVIPVVEPGRKICQCPGVPPERYTARTVELGVLGPDQEVRPGDADTDVSERKPANLAGPKAAAAGQAHDGQVHLHVGQASGAALQVFENRGQFLAGEDLRGVRSRLRSACEVSEELGRLTVTSGGGG
jgi:hypothetical protein